MFQKRLIALIILVVAFSLGYFYDGITGGWITSSYYMNDLPAWVNFFNEQKFAEKYISDLNKSGKYNSPIATEVVPYNEFWLAEKYHQNYIVHI